MKNEKSKIDKIVPALWKNKYLVIALIAAVVLLLLPSGSKKTETAADGLAPPDFVLSEQEVRLEKQLAKIDGVGQVSVLLSVSSSVSRKLAQGETGPLVLAAGGGEAVVEIYYVSPKYLGAVIVCQGADTGRVRLELCRAVEDFTGLRSDKISIIKMK